MTYKELMNKTLTGEQLNSVFETIDKFNLRNKDARKFYRLDHRNWKQIVVTSHFVIENLIGTPYVRISFYSISPSFTEDVGIEYIYRVLKIKEENGQKVGYISQAVLSQYALSIDIYLESIKV